MTAKAIAPREDHSRTIRPLPIPFVTTSFVGSITFAFACIPLWYLLGLDQFIWPFIMLFLSWRLIWQRAREGRGIVINKLARVGFLFLLVQIVSGLFIIENEFYIVFARNVLIWFGGLWLLIVLSSVLSRREQLFSLLWSWVFVALIASLVGVAAFFLREGFEIRTLILQLVPDSMRHGITAQTVWTRSLLAEPTRIGDAVFYRARSFFLYANSLAGILVLLIPILVYMWRLYRRFSPRWWIVSLALGLSIISLATTTSRAGILGLCIGLAVVVLVKTQPHDRLLWVALFALTVALVLFFALYDLDQTVDTAQATLEGFTTAKGLSHVTRFNILKYSLLSWSERPILGWGAPREMSLYGFSPNYPRLGSHSQFLAVLYRHGIVGLLVYLWFLLLLFRSFKDIPDGDWRAAFWPFLLWALISNLLHSVFTQLDIDVTMLYLVWAFWGILAALPKMPAVDKLANVK